MGETTRALYSVFSLFLAKGISSKALLSLCHCLFFVASPPLCRKTKKEKMRSSSTRCIAALVALSSWTGALAAADDQAAPLAAAGTTPNNLTGAGAMFGNKYQGDVSRKNGEREGRKERFPKCSSGARWRERRGRRRKEEDEQKTQPRPPFFSRLFFSLLSKKNSLSRAPTTATTAAREPAPISSPGSTASRGWTASLTEWR